MGAMSPVPLRVLAELTTRETDAVAALADQARDADAVAPLSEQTLLQLRRGPGHITHLLAQDGDRVAGYAQLDAPPGGPPSAELVVAPEQRGRGVGAALLARLLELAPAVRVWAHGMLPAARALAEHAGLSTVRELWRLARPLAPGDDFDISLPPGYAVTTFSAADGPAWLALNADAFADHPEQGRLTADDLADRMAQHWFDAAGFFLLRDPAGTPVAFHWTKIEGGVGEVYVVGVARSAQGLGLGRAATAIGLAHLRDRGCRRVVLYVDGDNVAALATYERAGFSRDHLDAQVAAR